MRLCCTDALLWDVWSGLDNVEWSSECGRSVVKQGVDNKFRTNESGLKIREGNGLAS
jgi:hypothetical protein